MAKKNPKPVTAEGTPAPAATAAIAAPIVIGDPEQPSLARALTPRVLLDSTPAEWLFSRPVETRHLILLAAFASLVFFPYLGAVGFWDPWEPHYGEVARSMIVREDYVHPYWENAYFFSKPVLSLWMMAVGMLVAGANSPDRGISIYTEWAVRSVFAGVALLGVLMVYLAVARTLSRRAGIWAAVVLATSPLYYLLARQAMVDMPFVAMNTAAIACLMVAVFEKERVQDGWLYGFYAFAGLAVLGKGLPGIALPGGAMLLYLVMSGDWHLLKRLRLLTGPLVTVAVAGPWLFTMIAFRGVDDESKTFFDRFIIHDHFKRLGVDPGRGFINGVHTTTPNTTFTYYVEQLGFGLFPWVSAIPGTLGSLFRKEPVDSPASRRRKARLFVLAWLFTTFALFALTATKFHHYIFPALPPLAILIGLWIEEVLEEGVTAHAYALLAGLLLTVMVAQNLAMEPKHLVNLFVYNYDRPYPTKETNPRPVFVALSVLLPAIALMGVPTIRGWLQRRKVAEDRNDRLFVVGAAAIVATLFAVYVSAYHWRKLTPHWTQRDLFWTYHQQSQATEPIAAYQMNWRGETFYSRNTVRQVKEAKDLRQFVAAPGREWVLVEHSRLAGMKSTLGSTFKVKVVDRSSNKFALVSVD